LKSKAVIKNDSGVSEFPAVGKGKETAAINAGHSHVDAGLRRAIAMTGTPAHDSRIKQVMHGS
jgi:hypothetical protein